MGRTHLVPCVGMACFSASGFKVVGNIDCLGSVFSQDPHLVHVHVSVCGSWVIVYANTRHTL